MAPKKKPVEKKKGAKRWKVAAPSNFEFVFVVIAQAQESDDKDDTTIPNLLVLMVATPVNV